MEKNKMTLPKIPPHSHCFKCNKVLPVYQSMCVKCVEETIKEDAIERKPYYESFVEEKK